RLGRRVAAPVDVRLGRAAGRRHDHEVTPAQQLAQRLLDGSVAQRDGDQLGVELRFTAVVELHAPARALADLVEDRLQRHVLPADDKESSMEIDRPLPNPMTPEAKPYWDGLREQKLMLPKCTACGHVFWYPRVACPKCHAREVGWVQASGRGTLHSFEIGHQA